jgi:Protein of unknown function (DUF3040)
MPECYQVTKQATVGLSGFDRVEVMVRRVAGRVRTDMALTDEERRHLDELAEELAAELACTDPDLVQALAEDLRPSRHRPRVLIQLLVLISLSLAVPGVVLVQPILFAAGCLSLMAAGFLTVTSHRRR